MLELLMRCLHRTINTCKILLRYCERTKTLGRSKLRYLDNIMFEYESERYEHVGWIYVVYFISSDRYL